MKSNGFVVFVFGTGCVETDAFCHKKANLHALENACAVVRLAFGIRKMSSDSVKPKYNFEISFVILR